MPAPDTMLAQRLRPRKDLAALPRFLADAGFVALESASPQTARAIFEAVCVVAPRSPVGGTGLAEALLQLGETRRAERAARAASRLIADRTTTAGAYLTLGKCRWHLGDHGAAKLAWADARVIDPTGPAGDEAAVLLERSDTPETLVFDSARPPRPPKKDSHR